MPPLLPREDCQRALDIGDRMAAMPCAKPREASDLAQRLCLLFRTPEGVHDAFVAALAAQFSLFPRSIGERLVDPLHGLASKAKFLPSVAELREALEAEQGRRKSLIYRARFLLQQHDKHDEEKRLEAERATYVGPERVAELLAGIFSHNVVTPEEGKSPVNPDPQP